MAGRRYRRLRVSTLPAYDSTLAHTLGDGNSLLAGDPLCTDDGEIIPELARRAWLAYRESALADWTEFHRSRGQRVPRMWAELQFDGAGHE